VSNSALNSTLKSIADARRMAKLRDTYLKSKKGDGPNPLASLPLMELIPKLNRGWSEPQHLKPMIDLLELVWERPVRMTVAAPVQHGKSSTLCAFIIATLLRDPTKRIVYVTYSHTLAQEKGREIRALARLAGLDISSDTDSKSEFRLKGGGGVYCTSIDGSLTGRALDIVIVDDPVKNRAQARSGAWQRVCKDFYNDVVETRARASVSVIVQMARWSTNDLIGMILDGTVGATTSESYKYQHICLQAENEWGEPLWPEQWSKERLAGVKGDLITWNSLFQCSPLAEGAEIFKNEIKTYQMRDLPHGLSYAIGVDLGYSAKTSADSSVAVCIARFGAGTSALYYIVDMISMQTTAPQFASKLKEMQQKWPAARTRMDAAGTERGGLDFMTAAPPIGLGMKIDVHPARSDKVVRAQPFSHIWNDGRLYVAEHAPWLREFTDQLIGFTGDGKSHDDAVDAAASAINCLLEGDTPNSITSSGNRVAPRITSTYNPGISKKNVWG